MKRIISETIVLNIVIGLLLAAVLVWQEKSLKIASPSTLWLFGVLGGVAGSFVAEFIKGVAFKPTFDWKQFGIGGAVASAIAVFIIVVFL